MTTTQITAQDAPQGEVSATTLEALVVFGVIVAGLFTAWNLANVITWLLNN